MVVIGCVPVGNPATATTFVLFDIRGTGVGTDWPATVSAWQPVIDSLVLPDPNSLTTNGINGGLYTDPLFGWSLQFDPARYEAQYGGGSADSTFLSGVFLYAEADGESGGVWTERHDDIQACLVAQSTVNASFPEFALADDPALIVPAKEGLDSALYQFEIEDGVPYLSFVGCMELGVDGSTVDGTFLVTSFSVSKESYADSVAAWQTMLDSIQFKDSANATPVA